MYARCSCSRAEVLGVKEWILAGGRYLCVEVRNTISILDRLSRRRGQRCSDTVLSGDVNAEELTVKYECMRSGEDLLREDNLQGVSR